VDAGLRLRSAPTTASATVAIEPPGANLLIIEPIETAKPKIGVYDQWLHVRDEAGRTGYVAAWYVEKGITVPPVEGGGDTGGADETPVPPVPVEEPVSEGEGEPTPEPESVPEPEPFTESEFETLTIYVSQSVGEAGLRLRKTASLGGALVTVLKAGTALTALEPADKARAKVGVESKWIHVSDPQRKQGYVAANYVELEVTPNDEPDAPSPTESESGPFTVYVTSAAAAGLRLREEPNTDSDTLMILPAGSELKVLEGREKVVGVYGKWLKVRESGGTEGYVAAWYLRK
jgi:hypothetical protein